MSNNKIAERVINVNAVPFEKGYVNKPNAKCIGQECDFYDKSMRRESGVIVGKSVYKYGGWLRFVRVVVGLLCTLPTLGFAAFSHTVRRLFSDTKVTKVFVQIIQRKEIPITFASVTSKNGAAVPDLKLTRADREGKEQIELRDGDKTIGKMTYSCNLNTLTIESIESKNSEYTGVMNDLIEYASTQIVGVMCVNAKEGECEAFFENEFRFIETDNYVFGLPPESKSDYEAFVKAGSNDETKARNVIRKLTDAQRDDLRMRATRYGARNNKIIIGAIEIVRYGAFIDLNMDRDLYKSKLATAKGTMTRGGFNP